MVPKMHYKSLIELKDTCLHLIKELKQGDYIKIKYSVPNIEFTKRGSTTQYIESVNVRETIRNNLSKRIEKFDKFKLLDLFNTEIPNFINHPIKYGGSTTPNNINQLIETLLANVIRLDPDLINPEKILIKDLCSLENILKNKKINVNLIVPIANFSIDNFSSDILFDDSIRIIKLSKQFLETRIVDSKLFQMYPRFAINIAYSEKLILANDPDWSTHYYQLENDFNDIVRKIVFSLNLTSPGGICTPMKYIKNMGFAKSWLPSYGSGSAGTLPYGKQCKINIDQIDTIVEVYKKINRNNFSKFEMPFKRLNEAELRLNTYDSIIDSVIALEYLLLNDIGNENDRGEMRFRFAMNYTTLFKEGKIKRRKFALDVYTLRSTIVHGATLKDKIQLGNRKVSVAQAALDIRHMLRDTLNYLIALPETENFYTSGFWLNRLFINSESK